MLTVDERIGKIEEAQELLQQAIELLRDADENDAHRRDIIANLEILCSSDHNWLSRDANLDGWIAELENGEVED